MAPTESDHTKPKHESATSVAKCYACGTEKPISEFRYKKRDRGASGSIIKRWFRLLKTDKSPGNTEAPKYQYRCVFPSVGSCPRFNASSAAQPRCSRIRTQPTRSYQTSSQPRSQQNFELYAGQPEMTPSLWAAREEYNISRERFWGEREDMYEYTPGGLAIPKYQEPPQFSQRWLRDNDLY